MNEDLEKELGSEEGEKVNREELKEVEQEMIIRELEATENQLKVKILVRGVFAKIRKEEQIKS